MPPENLLTATVLQVAENHTVAHDPKIISLDIMVHEAVPMHLFDCLNHLEENFWQKNLVGDALNL